MYPSGVAKSSTIFSWGKGGKVTAAGWQVTLCDPIWHVISCSGEVISTNCYIRFTLLYFTYFDVHVSGQCYTVVVSNDTGHKKLSRRNLTEGHIDKQSSNSGTS